MATSSDKKADSRVETPQWPNPWAEQWVGLFGFSGWPGNWQKVPEKYSMPTSCTVIKRFGVEEITCGFADRRAGLVTFRSDSLPLQIRRNVLHIPTAAEAIEYYRDQLLGRPHPAFRAILFLLIVRGQSALEFIQSAYEKLMIKDAAYRCRTRQCSITWDMSDENAPCYVLCDDCCPSCACNIMSWRLLRRMPRCRYQFQSVHREREHCSVMRPAYL
jgi:hypothetical protein